MIYNEKWHSNNIGILYYTRLEQLTMTNNKIRDMYMGYHHNVTVCEIDIVNSTQWVTNHTPIEMYAAMCKFDKLVSSLTQEYDVCSFEFVGDSIVVVSKSTIQLLMFCHAVIMNMHSSIFKS